MELQYLLTVNRFDFGFLLKSYIPFGINTEYHSTMAFCKLNIAMYFEESIDVNIFSETLYSYVIFLVAGDVRVLYCIFLYISLRFLVGF